jgi:citrate lyase subunit beta/citryl-CoA lyase
MIAKSRLLRPDQVILDLEDSVPGEMKGAARTTVVGELAQGGWSHSIVSVRVNPIFTEAGRLDLEALSSVGPQLATVVVPKVNAPDDIVIVADALNPRSSTGVEALVETAGGLDNVRAIASSSPALEALIFGPLDMAASLGIDAFEGEQPHGYPGDLWHYARFRILVAARAAGVDAIDGPFPVVTDLHRLRTSADLAAATGYDGKWVIHPSQIEPVNQAFTPTREAFERATEILTVLKHAERDGIAAVTVNGVMIDAASCRMAERIVIRGRVAGLS